MYLLVHNLFINCVYFYDKQCLQKFVITCFWWASISQSVWGPYREHN